MRLCRQLHTELIDTARSAENGGSPHEATVYESAPCSDSSAANFALARWCRLRTVAELIANRRLVSSREKPSQYTSRTISRSSSERCAIADRTSNRELWSDSESTFFSSSPSLATASVRLLRDRQCPDRTLRAMPNDHSRASWGSRGTSCERLQMTTKVSLNRSAASAGCSTRRAKYARRSADSRRTSWSTSATRLLFTTDPRDT